VSRDWCPVATAAGALCVDLSAAFRQDSANLLVAGINTEQQGGAMISTPASSTVQLAYLLGALRQVAELRSILVTRFAPASALGKRGLAELQGQAGDLLNGRPVIPQVFSAQLAFNGIPFANSDQDTALAAELAKVLAITDLDIHINSLHLPLFYGEGAFVRVEFSGAVSAGKVKDAIAAAEALALQEPSEFPTLLDAIGAEEVLVSLCAPPVGPATCFDFWYAADSAGRCAAGNVVRLAEVLVKRIGLSPRG
jgi:aspartate-semialdehyde dehydrogenase